MNTEIKELVIYTVKEELKMEYQKVQHIVKACLEEMPGYLGVQSYRSCGQDNQLMDWVGWETLAHAKNAQQELEKHPQFALLMQYVEGMKFSGHFKN